MDRSASASGSHLTRYEIAMDIRDEPNSMDDVDGTEAMSTSLTPGNLEAMVDQRDNNEPLDEFTVAPEGQRAAVTGRVLGAPATPNGRA